MDGAQWVLIKKGKWSRTVTSMWQEMDMLPTVVLGDDGSNRRRSSECSSKSWYGKKFKFNMISTLEKKNKASGHNDQQVGQICYAYKCRFENADTLNSVYT